MKDMTPTKTELLAEIARLREREKALAKAQREHDELKQVYALNMVAWRESNRQDYETIRVLESYLKDIVATLPNAPVALHMAKAALAISRERRMAR